MSKHAAVEPPITEWRHLSQFLWVGVGQHGHVGTVERGRRFKAIDDSGVLVARCRRLQEAQALLELVAESRRLSADPRDPAA